MPSDLSNLTGVGVAAIAVILFYKLSANHIKHNTEVLGELRDAITKLLEFLEKHIKING